jgi:hypothetical protein
VWQGGRELRGAPRHAEFSRWGERFHAAAVNSGGERSWISDGRGLVANTRAQVYGVSQFSYVPYPNGEVRGPTWTPEGKIIYFNFPRGSEDANIWLSEPDGTNPKQLTANTGGANVAPRVCVSANNRHVVFSRMASIGICPLQYFPVQRMRYQSSIETPIRYSRDLPVAESLLR